MQIRIFETIKLKKDFLSIKSIITLFFKYVWEILKKFYKIKIPPSHVGVSQINNQILFQVFAQTNYNFQIILINISQVYQKHHECIYTHWYAEKVCGVRMCFNSELTCSKYCLHFYWYFYSINLFKCNIFIPEKNELSKVWLSSSLK